MAESSRASMRAACASETARKRTWSPGRSWPIFHSSACDDGSGTDEAAEARAVGAEDHGHVAGEIDGADGVGVVVDVGGVQAGFAAVLARPLRASGRSGARRCGRNCSAPSSRGRKNVVDVRWREEIGRAVRAVEHADLPVVGVVPVARASRLVHAPLRRPADRADTSPARRTRPAWPPNPPRMKVLALPRYSGTRSRPRSRGRRARRGRARLPISSSRSCRRPATGCQRGIGAPSSCALKSAPVSAIMAVAARSAASGR